MGSLSSPVTSTILRSPFPPSPSRSPLLSRMLFLHHSNSVPSLSCRFHIPRRHRHRPIRSRSVSEIPDDDGEESLVQSLRVPESWMLPANALQESEWLRVTLHKWLDDEYCPEDANVEISKVAARSYYESLIAKQGDLGEILMNMVRALESVSFQESFHGVFSSANAAVHLITSRLESSIQE